MNNNIKIGGEFEINPFTLKGFEEFNVENSVVQFSSGRSALNAILLHLSDKVNSVIYVPYYICHSVVQACMNANFEIRYYELNDDFKFPIKTLENITYNSCILSVNYFGFIGDNDLIDEIKAKRPDITILGDHVQSFWTCQFSKADYSFTSLRKHFAISDGALVYKKGRLWISDKNYSINSFSDKKILGSFLKNIKVNDSIYLKMFSDGEQLLDVEKTPTFSSDISKFLFDKLDLKFISGKKQENYEFLHEYGEKNGLEFIFPFNSKNIPLCVPIVVKNRNSLRRELVKNNIYLPIHWQISNFNKISSKASWLSKNEISLVIDQRYNIEDMRYQLDLLVKYIR